MRASAFASLTLSSRVDSLGLHRVFQFFQESSMGNKLYVGNLPYTFRDSDLEQAFSEFGAVNSAKVMMERDTGRSKGFGFVEMGSDAEAQAAIQGLHGQNRGGRDLVVRSEEHTSELQSPCNLVCRLLLEK